VYASDRSELGEDGTDLYVIPITGGPITRLTNDGSALTEGAPRWSPDGAQIVFDAAPSGSKARDLYLMNADGSNPRQIVTGGDNYRPQWSPDGRFIAFVSTRTSKTELFVYEVATQALYQLTTSPTTIILTDWAE
jgi:Tol biopolymer transport system component